MSPLTIDPKFSSNGHYLTIQMNHLPTLLYSEIFSVPKLIKHLSTPIFTQPMLKPTSDIEVPQAKNELAKFCDDPTMFEHLIIGLKITGLVL